MIVVVSTRSTAFPNKVCTPVAITTPSIAPCLHVETEYTPSPRFLVTGSDSLVRADWKRKTIKKKKKIPKENLRKVNTFLKK